MSVDARRKAEHRVPEEFHVHDKPCVRRVAGVRMPCGGGEAAVEHLVVLRHEVVAPLACAHNEA